MGRFDAADRRADHDAQRRRRPGAAAAAGAAARRDPADLSQRRRSRPGARILPASCERELAAQHVRRRAGARHGRRPRRAAGRQEVAARQAGRADHRRGRPARHRRRHADAQAARRVGRRKETGRSRAASSWPRSARELAAMQKNLFERALALRTANTRTITKLDEFEAFFTPAERRQARDPRRLRDLPLCRRARRRPRSWPSTRSRSAACRWPTSRASSEHAAGQVHLHRPADDRTGPCSPRRISEEHKQRGRDVFFDLCTKTPDPLCSSHGRHHRAGTRVARAGGVQPASGGARLGPERAAAELGARWRWPARGFPSRKPTITSRRWGRAFRNAFGPSSG